MSASGPHGKSPTKWAAMYYQGGKRQSARRSLRDAQSFWDSIDPVPTPKVGLPEYVPRLSSNAGGVTNLSAVLTALETAYAEGYGEALVSAIGLCFEYSDESPPAWVKRAFGNGVGRLRDRVCKTLDQAFNIKRAREKKASASFSQIHGGQIYLDVVKAREAGVSIGDPLFSAIAKRYESNASTIKDIYYAEQSDVKGGHFSENYAIETTHKK